MFLHLVHHPNGPLPSPFKPTTYTPPTRKVHNTVQRTTRVWTKRNAFFTRFLVGRNRTIRRQRVITRHYNRIPPRMGRASITFRPWTFVPCLNLERLALAFNLRRFMIDTLSISHAQNAHALPEYTSIETTVNVKTRCESHLTHKVSVSTLTSSIYPCAKQKAPKGALNLLPHPGKPKRDLSIPLILQPPMLFLQLIQSRIYGPINIL